MDIRGILFLHKGMHNKHGKWVMAFDINLGICIEKHGNNLHHFQGLKKGMSPRQI
jgi:hypothetical protein